MAKTVVLSKISSVGFAAQRLADALVQEPVNVVFASGDILVVPQGAARAVSWLRVLEAARIEGLPVYALTDDEGVSLEQLLVPMTVRVTRIEEGLEGDLEVDLEISHARHYLRRTSPRFEELATALREAQTSGEALLVTEDDEHNIVDVRASQGEEPPPLVTHQPPTKGLLALAPTVAVPQGVAQQMFDLVAAQTCDPQTVPAPCIPFLYPDDGCWGRAHQMARLMIAAGQQPGKIWIYGRLRAASRNNPNCAVFWGWHVAATLEIDNGTGGSDTYVIDPSLFPLPVLQAQWASVQGDLNPVVAATDATIFYRSSGGGTVTDPSFSQTARVLATYRLKLQLRATGTDGPPPYARCP